MTLDKNFWNQAILWSFKHRQNIPFFFISFIFLSFLSFIFYFLLFYFIFFSFLSSLVIFISFNSISLSFKFLFHFIYFNSSCVQRVKRIIRLLTRQVEGKRIKISDATRLLELSDGIFLEDSFYLIISWHQYLSAWLTTIKLCIKFIPKSNTASLIPLWLFQP